MEIVDENPNDRTVCYLFGVTTLLYNYKTDMPITTETVIEYGDTFMSDKVSILECISEIETTVKDFPEELQVQWEILQSNRDKILQNRTDAFDPISFHKNCRNSLRKSLNVVGKYNCSGPLPFEKEDLFWRNFATKTSLIIWKLRKWADCDIIKKTFGQGLYLLIFFSQFNYTTVKQYLLELLFYASVHLHVR